MSERPMDPAHDKLPNALMWVKDAPMFIDENSLNRFYDAIVRPTFQETDTREIEVSEGKRSELKQRFGLEAGLMVPGWLSWLMSGGLEAGIGAAKVSDGSTSSVRKLTLEAIKTPERQLEQLLAFFLLRREDRLLAGGPADALEWHKKGLSQDVPRALVLLDLPVGAQLIPMAAEFTNGRVSTFFDKLVRGNGERPPTQAGETEDLWKWLSASFDPHQAMRLIEDAATQQDSRIEWIDYRLPLDNAGATMHVHIESNGRYHTGNFAYRLVRRCYGHGMRVIGTLKDGPDLNVLAIYER